MIDMIGELLPERFRANRSRWTVFLGTCETCGHAVTATARRTEPNEEACAGRTMSLSSSDLGAEDGLPESIRLARVTGLFFDGLDGTDGNQTDWGTQALEGEKQGWLESQGGM